VVSNAFLTLKGGGSQVYTMIYGKNSFLGFYDGAASLDLGFTFIEANGIMQSAQQSIPGGFQILSNHVVGAYLGRANQAEIGAARFVTPPYFADNAGNSKYLGMRTAAPTFGRYEVGDVFWNSAPTVASAFGWRCVTAGSPGTWETMTPGSGGGSGVIDTAIVRNGIQVVAGTGSNPDTYS
jgi:hypothetical protein